jgi:hypothetical protein
MCEWAARTLLVGLTACSGTAGSDPGDATDRTDPAAAAIGGSTYPEAPPPSPVRLPPLPPTSELPPRPTAPDRDGDGAPDPTQPPFVPPPSAPPAPDEVCADVGGAHVCLDDRTADVGQTITLTGLPEDCSLTVSWFDGDPPGCASTHAYEAEGSYVVVVAAGEASNRFAVDVTSV